MGQSALALSPFHQCFSNYQGGGQWPGEHSAASLPVIMGATGPVLCEQDLGTPCSWGWKLGLGLHTAF